MKDQMNVCLATEPQPDASHELARTCKQNARQLRNHDADPHWVHAWCEAADILKHLSESNLEQIRELDPEAIANHLGTTKNVARVIHSLATGLPFRDNKPGNLALEPVALLRRNLRGDTNAHTLHGNQAWRPGTVPSTRLLLAVDQEFRLRSQTGRLSRVNCRTAVSGANPWVEVWETVQDHWHFTVFHSNSPRTLTSGNVENVVIILFSNGENHGRLVVKMDEAT